MCIGFYKLWLIVWLEAPVDVTNILQVLNIWRNSMTV